MQEDYDILCSGGEGDTEKNYYNTAVVFRDDTLYLHCHDINVGIYSVRGSFRTELIRSYSAPLNSYHYLILVPQMYKIYKLYF